MFATLCRCCWCCCCNVVLLCLLLLGSARLSVGLQLDCCVVCGRGALLLVFVQSQAGLHVLAGCQLVMPHGLHVWQLFAIWL